jgi:acetyl esterase/lipase
MNVSEKPRMILTRLLVFAALLLPACAFAADEPQVVRLWPGDAPGSEGKTGEEVVVGNRVSNVHRPSITVYLPAKQTATGAAVIVCPGGGHQYLAIDYEGYDVAKWLSDHGIAGFVLKYRLAREPGSTYKVEVHALADAQRAIRTVRSRALEWGIDPNRVGIIGFSAGGGVAALAGTRFDDGNPNATSPVERPSSRPNFFGLFYPGISPETLTVTSNTPPCFLVHADNDRTVPVDRSVTFYTALKKAGVSAELHIYANGGHGFGLRPTNRNPVASWPARFQEWLDDRGFLKTQ